MILPLRRWTRVELPVVKGSPESEAPMLPHEAWPIRLHGRFTLCEGILRAGERFSIGS